MTAQEVIRAVWQAGVEFVIRHGLPPTLSGDPGPGLLAAVKEHKEEIVQILTQDAAEVEKPAWVEPPAGAQFFFQNHKGQPCSRQDAAMWTYTGGATWWPVESNPPPVFRKGKK